MEQLARFVLISIAVSFVLLLAGLYLLHAAINESNAWKGLVAVILILFCGSIFVRGVGGLS